MCALQVDENCHIATLIANPKVLTRFIWYTFLPPEFSKVWIIYSNGLRKKIVFFKWLSHKYKSSSWGLKKKLCSQPKNNRLSINWKMAFHNLRLLSPNFQRFTDKQSLSYPNLQMFCMSCNTTPCFARLSVLFIPTWLVRVWLSGGSRFLRFPHEGQISEPGGPLIVFTQCKKFPQDIHFSPFRQLSIKLANRFHVN